MKPLRVLSIEGGGIRGYYSASLLDKLSLSIAGNSDYDIGKEFDLICGTSTGAILACGLAFGLRANEIKEIYKNNANSIFKSPVPASGLKKFFWAINHMVKPSSNQEALYDALNEKFSSDTLGNIFDSRGIALCIPVVDYAAHVSEVFKTPHLNHLNRDNDLTLIDVCMASTAAPIFFPIHKINHSNPLLNERYFVDGGLWANNPTLVALTEALQLCEDDQEIEIYNLGTITINDSNPRKLKKLNKGLWNWDFGIDTLKLSVAAQSDSHNDFATLLARSYTELGKKISIYNFIETVAGSKQYEVLGLDQISPEAFLAMETLSTNNATLIKAKQQTDPTSCSMICDLFSQP